MATSGKCGGLENDESKRKTVVVGCDELPIERNGKE